MVENEVVDQQPHGDRPAVAPAPVTIKASAIEPGSVVKDENASNLPYHTKETENLAKERESGLKNQEAKPYEFKANGYIVTEQKSTPKIAAGDKPGELVDGPEATTYLVKAGDFEKGFASKREAEIYAETHAPYREDRTSHIVAPPEVPAELKS